jgi:hypothetical protein
MVCLSLPERHCLASHLSALLRCRVLLCVGYLFGTKASDAQSRPARGHAERGTAEFQLRVQPCHCDWQETQGTTLGHRSGPTTGTPAFATG